MIPCAVFDVQFMFGVSVYVSLWALVAACGCGIVVGFNRLFVLLCFGVHNGEK